MKVWVPKEHAAHETRVAATPETVKKMVAEGFTVEVEQGAGRSAHFEDAQYTEAGANIVETSGVAQAFAGADVVLKVAPLAEHPTEKKHEAELLKDGAIVIGFTAPYKHHDVVKKLQSKHVSSLAMELVPRITRAQSMDALSSQASIGGYKAVLLAATHLDKYFPLLMTAAGTIQPAKIVIMGAGVAGLQAIATGKRLGAVVEVSDIRPTVKEQVESLGGKFIDLPMEESGEGEGGYAKEVSKEFLQKQQQIVREKVVAADVVITTALVPGRPAPKLITEDMVKEMRSGAVIIDMAVEQGGNCELSENGKDVEVHGVKIVGHPNLPATMPHDASLLYARNVFALLSLLKKEEGLAIDVEDEVIDGALLTHGGKIHHKQTREAIEGPDPVSEAPKEKSPQGNEPEEENRDASKNENRKEASS